jgi:hypothetical protein
MRNQYYVLITNDLVEGQPQPFPYAEGHIPDRLHNSIAGHCGRAQIVSEEMLPPTYPEVAVRTYHYRRTYVVHEYIEK